MRRIATLLLCGVVGLLPATALAATSVDKIAASLEKSHVFVEVDTAGTTSETARKLSDQLHNDDNIVIVMLPDGAGDAIELVNRLNDATGNKYIIGVTVGDTVATASSTMPSGEAADQMKRAESVSSSTTETLVTFIRNVHDWQDLHPQESTSKPTDKGGGSSGLILAILAGAALSTVAAAVVLTMRRRRGIYQTEMGDIRFLSSPSDVRELLQAIMEMRRSIHDRQLVQLIGVVCSDTEQYFRRSTTSGNRMGDTAVFVGHLESVHKVVGRYIDIQDNPRYYDEPEVLKQKGREAIQDFVNFVLESIKEGRRSDLIEFEVNTEILGVQRYN